MMQQMSTKKAVGRLFLNIGRILITLVLCVVLFALLDMRQEFTRQQNIMKSSGASMFADYMSRVLGVGHGAMEIPASWWAGLYSLLAVCILLIIIALPMKPKDRFLKRLWARIMVKLFPRGKFPRLRAVLADTTRYPLGKELLQFLGNAVRTVVCCLAGPFAVTFTVAAVIGLFQLKIGDAFSSLIRGVLLAALFLIALPLEPKDRWLKRKWYKLLKKELPPETNQPVQQQYARQAASAASQLPGAAKQLLNQTSSAIRQQAAARTAQQAAPAQPVQQQVQASAGQQYPQPVHISRQNVVQLVQGLNPDLLMGQALSFAAGADGRVCVFAQGYLIGAIWDQNLNQNMLWWLQQHMPMQAAVTYCDAQRYFVAFDLYLYNN